MPYKGIARVTGAAAAATSALALAAVLPAPASADSGGAAMSGGAGAQASTVGGHHYPGDSIHMGDRILRRGMHGHDVRVLQDFLTRAGIATTVDGAFGATTRMHVISFERAHHLRPNGIVTWTVSQTLRAAVAAVPAPAPQAPAGHAVLVHGQAVAPSDAPAAVRGAIAAANRIATRPYVYGGGHGSFVSSGYDCSGSVSYALHGGGLLSSPEDSSQMESYGSGGSGRWITIYANAGHAYMVIAGLRFDTSAQSSTGGSRWTTAGRSSAGYVIRHPSGY